MAIPGAETLKKIIPEDKLWPPDWDTWEYWGLFYNLMFNFGHVEIGQQPGRVHQQQPALSRRSASRSRSSSCASASMAPSALCSCTSGTNRAPIIGSGLFDYYRRPYKAYEAMKAVYTPVLVSLEWNKEPYHLGWEKTGGPAIPSVGKLWVTNDHYQALDAELSWQLLNATTHEVILEGGKDVRLPEDSSATYSEIVWSVPRARGSYLINMRVTDKTGKALSTNYFDFSVY